MTDSLGPGQGLEGSPGTHSTSTSQEGPSVTTGAKYGDEVWLPVLAVVTAGEPSGYPHSWTPEKENKWQQAGWE